MMRFFKTNHWCLNKIPWISVLPHESTVFSTLVFHLSVWVRVWQGLNEFVVRFHFTLSSLFAVLAGQNPDWAASESQQLDWLKENEIAQVQSASCFTSPFPASSMLKYSSNFFMPPLVDASLSFNSLISLFLHRSPLCPYGLTLQLNSVLLGLDGHTITAVV